MSKYDSLVRAIIRKLWSPHGDMDGENIVTQ